MRRRPPSHPRRRRQGDGFRVLRAQRVALLSALCCVAVGGCASTSRSTASGLYGVSNLSGVSSPSVASSHRAVVSALSCGDDRESGRVVAVYRAMLADPDYPDAEGATHLYVSTTLTNGDAFGTSAGLMSDAVKQCLSAGVAGWPPISLVSGRDDPSMPTAPIGDGVIPSFIGHVAFVTFGDVVVAGSKAISSVTVDKGGGDVGGAEYVLKVADSGATIVSSNLRWMS